MADASNIKVAIEAAVINALAEVAQRVYDQHGIRINAASLDWSETSSITAEKFLVTEVRVDLTARPRPEST
jgi:hypothetical protein